MDGLVPVDTAASAPAGRTQASDSMNVAVLSVCRDRLDYTKHCFSQLDHLAGVEYDHLVFDNGSQDDTVDWLRNEYAPTWLETSPSNVGISNAVNALLERCGGYDVIVKFDNDCEVTTPNVLLDAARLVYGNPKWLVSPRIEGLNSPPPVESETVVDGQRVGVTGLIGGIFLAANAGFYTGFRHDAGNPSWGMDDVDACDRMRRAGGRVGYLLDHVANHFETTEGQKVRYPDYWTRKLTEFNA